MNKNILKQDYFLPLVAFILSLVGFFLFIILIDVEILYEISLNLSFGIFFFSIIGSLTYSSGIIKKDLFFFLSFGVTRKSIYREYLKTLLIVLVLSLVYSLILFFNCYFSLKDIKIGKLFIDFHYLFLIPFYFLINFIFFRISNVKKSNLYFFIFIPLVSIIILVSKYFVFFDIIGLVISILAIILFFYNQKLIKKVY